MKSRKYKAFTLVEMLIVMGILSVLMAIGVSVARFAIQRANNIQHQSAVDQLYQAYQSYYTDNRSYPGVGTTYNPGEPSNESPDFDTSLNADFDAGGVLNTYVDANFDGGSPARFWYFTSGASYPQEFMVCVSYAEPEISVDTNESRGGYCNGNGFGILGSETMFTKKVYDVPGEFITLISDATTTLTGSTFTDDWNGNDWD